MGVRAKSLLGVVVGGVAAVSLAVPAFAVTSSTVTDAAGDVKTSGPAATVKASPVAASSVDISQYTVSVDQGSKKVFVKIRAKDVAPSVVKSKKKTVQTFGVVFPQLSSGYFRVRTDAPSTLVQGQGIERPAAGSGCVGAAVSTDFSANTVTFSAPLSCFGSEVKSVSVQQTSGFLSISDGAASAYDSAKGTKVATK